MVKRQEHGRLWGFMKIQSEMNLQDLTGQVKNHRCGILTMIDGRILKTSTMEFWCLAAYS
jgi:hypothetical protein